MTKLAVIWIAFALALAPGHALAQSQGSARCMFGVVPLSGNPNATCGGGLLWNNLQWRYTTIRCKDGAVDPGPIDPCLQLPYYNDWLNAIPSPSCDPVVAILDDCDPSPEPPECRDPDPANNVSSCIGDPVDVTTGNLEQIATDIDLGRGLTFIRHYASDDESTISSSMGARWRHSLDWRLEHRTPQQGGAQQPKIETAVVWRPLGGADPFLRVTLPPPGIPDPPWKGGSRSGGGLSGDPASGFIYTDSGGTRIYFDGQSLELEKIQPPGEPAIAVDPIGSVTTFTNGGACLAVTTTGGKVRSVASRPASSCSDGPGTPLWSYDYDDAGCLLTATASNHPGTETGAVVWRYVYPTDPETGDCDSTSIERVERSVDGAAFVPIAAWTWDSALDPEDQKVLSVDEPGLDQKLYLSYPNSTTTTVSDVGGAALATFTTDAGRVVSTVGSGGPGVEIPIAQATFTGPTPVGVAGGYWKTISDRNGVKTLYQSYDGQGRPGIVTEGWKDPNGNDVIDGAETFARRREYMYHPSLDAPLTIREQSVRNSAGSREIIDDYDADVDDNYNLQPTDLLHRRISKGWTLNAAGEQVSFMDTITYDYDGNDRLISIAGPRGSDFTEFAYDSQGRRTLVRRYHYGPNPGWTPWVPYLDWGYSSFDASGNPQEVTDPNGRITHFSYDALNRVKSAMPPYEGNLSTTVTFKYDLDGNLEKVSFPPDTAGDPVYLDFAYDPVKPDLLLSIEDSKKNAIVYEYEKGRAVSELHYRNYGVTSGPSEGQQSLTRQASYRYYRPNDPPGNDDVGRLWRAFNPLFADNSISSSFKYDPKGNLTDVTDENGLHDTLIYDALDRLVEIQQTRYVPGFGTASSRSHFAYDKLSNVASVAGIDGKTTVLRHDDRGNLVESDSPDTGLTRFVYDKVGNLEAKVEAAGTPSARTTTYGYDGLSRLQAIGFPHDPGWVFVYDTDDAKNQRGRLASVSNGFVRTELEYTMRGDVAKEATILGGFRYDVQYGYDAAGNRVSILAPSGHRVTTDYSGLRPSRLAVTAGGRTEAVTGIQWDPFGPRIQADLPPHDGTANTVRSTRQLNARGQVGEVKVDRLAASPETLLRRVYTYNATTGGVPFYDPGPSLDRVEDLVPANPNPGAPSDSRVYFYSAFAQPNLGRLNGATNLQGTSQYSYFYDEAGNLLLRSSPGSGIVTFDYESGTNRIDSASGLEETDYAHDAYGNRIYEGEADFAGTPSLIYDDSNRLVEVRDPANEFETVVTYTYDAFGRRIQKDLAGDGLDAHPLLFFYDTEGHLFEQVSKDPWNPDPVRTYVYLEDELLMVVNQAQDVGSIAVSLPGVAVWPLPPSLPLLILAATAGIGAALLTRRPAFGLATTGSGVALLLLCAGTNRPPPTFAVVHTDSLGTPIAMTDAPRVDQYSDAVVVWAASYEPFGKATVDQDPDGDNTPIGLNVRFPGQYFDAETGYHSNFQRDYDPAIGRYLTADPIGLNEHIARAFDPSVDRRRVSLELTPYAYANSNPTLFTDPTGQYGLPGALAGAAFNLSLQFGTNFAFNGGNATNALLCIDLADVAISAALGAVAPTFFSNILRGKPGPFGHTRLQNFKLFVPAFLGGAAAKKLAPEYPIGDPCECEETSVGALIKDFLHGF